MLGKTKDRMEGEEWLVLDMIAQNKASLITIIFLFFIFMFFIIFIIENHNAYLIQL